MLHCISPWVESLRWASETQIPFPRAIFTFSHLRHQCHCHSKCICAPGPKHCGSFACASFQDPSCVLHLWMPAYQMKRQEESHGLGLPPVGIKGEQEKKQQLLPLMFSIATIATHRTSAILATENPHALCWHWLQLMELHRDYISVPFQETKMLHPTQPLLTQPPSGESLALPYQSKKAGRGNCVLKYTDINTKPSEMKNQGNMILPKEHSNFPETKICELSEKEFKIIILRKVR